MRKGQRAGCDPLSLILCPLELDAALNSTKEEEEEKNNGSKKNLLDSIQGHTRMDLQNKVRDRAGGSKTGRDTLGWQDFRGAEGPRERDKFGKEAEGDSLWHAILGF